MNIYCIKIKYTKEAIKGMMEEGVDRADALRNLTEALGGKLLSFYGMVGFDPSHKRCIDENYVRISCGYDFIDASPIKGVKLNYLGEEALNFKLDINIEQ